MEEFFTQNSIYVVLVIVLVIFTGLFIYLLRLERKLTALEQQFSEQDDAQQKR
ncbi:MAG: CcmD family protein [Candidatus Thermochlorobacter sp.]